jgi:hypothetical protein
MTHARNPLPSVQEKPVTTDKRPFEEMNTIAKEIRAQALVMTDDYFTFLKKTISSNPSQGTEVGAVLKSNAERTSIWFRNTCINSPTRRIFRTPSELKASSYSLNSPQWGSKQRILAMPAANQLVAFLATPSRTSHSWSALDLAHEICHTRRRA